MTVTDSRGGTIIDQIRDVTGAHLTAADKRNIRAIIAQPGFVEGETYKVNDRKHYRLKQVGPERWAVSVTERETDWLGETRDRRYRSVFTSS